MNNITFYNEDYDLIGGWFCGLMIKYTAKNMELNMTNISVNFTTNSTKAS